MTKGILSDGRSYEVHEDGSVSVQCKVCFREERLPADHVFVASHKDSGSYGDYTCTPCWKEQQAKFKQIEKEQRNDDIAYAQAWNLAVMSYGPIEFELHQQEELKRRQQWFYKQLVERSNDKGTNDEK